MPRRLALIGFIFALTNAAAAVCNDDFSRDVKPLVDQYCGKCHNSVKKVGDVALDKFIDEASVLKEIDTWEKALENLRGGTMPPPGKPKPTEAELAKLARWIEQTLAKAPPPAKMDPGSITLRRLNRAEYNNTIRDLLAVDLHLADDFPADDSGYGFDNNGDVLSLPPLLFEKYLTAADRAIEAALTIPPPLVGPEFHRRYGNLELQSTQPKDDRFENPRRLTSNGELSVNAKTTLPGDYLFRIRAFQEKAGDEDAKMILRVDGKDLKTVEVKPLKRRAQNYTVTVKLTPGVHKLGAVYINDFYDPKAANVKERDRNLSVYFIELEGPVGGPPRPQAMPESYSKIMIAKPNGKNDRFVASRILRNFARRAFRRPASNAEVDRLIRLYDVGRSQGETYDAALRTALQAVLVAPQFLFRIELDKPTTDADGVHPVSDYELATRLSYFLWSSMPDETLLTLAAHNGLHDPEALEGQVRRMLKDPKAWALVENFAGQWLQVRNLNLVTPSEERYPQWDEALRKAMLQETQLFFNAVLTEDRDFGDFLDADFTFLNERLARHYAISDVYGKEFRRVSLDRGRRGGLLTQASVLTVTSNQTRTSPVKRGKWILDNILNSPPPPPPPGVSELKDDKHGELTGSLRQRMEQHRANASCASCHQRMDPLGFAFENFDGIGAWRSVEGKYPIDSSGVLPGGETFRGPDGLKVILRKRRDQFRRCLAEKLLTYALGRGVEKFDRQAVDAICQATASAGDKFQSLIVETAKSEPFLKAKNKRGAR